MWVLVTGATGAIGLQVVHALREVEYQVRTLSLDAPSSGMLHDGVQSLIGDVTDPSVTQSSMQGVDTVVHLAALLHLMNPPVELREKYERVNVGGTATVVEAAVKAGVRRVVLFSTIAVYGQTEGQILNEDSPVQPDTYYAQTKLAAEQIVLNAMRVDGQPLGTVLRLGAVYGARIKGNYRRLVQALARRRFIPIGNGSNRRTLIYDKDVARAAVLAMQHPTAAGKIYNVSDGQFHSVDEIIKTICWALGRTPPRIAVPVGPVRLIAGLLEGSAKLMRRQLPLVRATVDKFIEDIAVDGNCIQRELGFSPQYDLRTGWQETIREMRRFGDL
jgi:UDP-glucose 4-epimerase